jgi:hypothetical protein
MAETKALRAVEIKDADKGTVEAVFATFNTIDSDKDVTLPDAFEEGAKLRISAYGHASWGPSRGASSVPLAPVGKGVIRTTADEAILQGQFFLKTGGGRDTFELVKEMDDLQEWSYGYDTLESERGTFEGQKVRFLKRQVVHEVSPVLLGSGVGTRTLAFKSKQLDSDLRAALDSAGRDRFGSDTSSVWVEDFDLDDDWAVFSVYEKDGDTRWLRVSYSRDENGAAALAGDESEVERETVYEPKKSMSFADEARAAHVAAEALVNRTSSLAEVRRGRLSTTKREQLAPVSSALGETKRALDELLATSDPRKHRDALLHEIARFERLRATELIGGTR